MENEKYTPWEIGLQNPAWMCVCACVCVWVPRTHRTFCVSARGPADLLWSPFKQVCSLSPGAGAAWIPGRPWSVSWSHGPAVLESMEQTLLILLGGHFLRLFFDVDHFLKPLQNLSQYCFPFLLYVLLFWLLGMWDLSSPTRDQTRNPPRFGRWSLLTTGPPGKSPWGCLFCTHIWLHIDFLASMFYS